MKSQLQRNTTLSIYDDATKVHRLNKIICTIGPRTQSVEALKGLMREGMNVARMNFSHGSHEFHAVTIANVRAAAAELGGLPIAIALDTKGPEIRTGLFTNGEAQVLVGSTVVVTCDPTFAECGTSEKFFIDYPRVCSVVSIGGHVFLDDGVLDLEIVEIDADAKSVKCIAKNSHTLSNRKGVNLPSAAVDLPAVSEQDKADLRFGAEQGVDIIFASFIRSPEQVHDVRAALGDKSHAIMVISKIENHQGVNAIDQIIAASDGIMVARGDLGVEIPAEKVAIAQKMIISKCMVQGKPVICATQMLESMVVNPRPTRAEVSDVANAVLDGADCVMLSGETAKGKYPNEVVRYMAKICCEAQNASRGSFTYWAVKEARTAALSGGQRTKEDSICCSAVNSAFEMSAKAIVTISNTGNCAREVATYRPSCPIFCASQKKEVCRRVNILRGVVPVYYDTEVLGEDRSREKRVALCIEEGRRLGELSSGDFVVIVHADHKTLPSSGGANQTKIVQLT